MWEASGEYIAHQQYGTSEMSVWGEWSLRNDARSQPQPTSSMSSVAALISVYPEQWPIVGAIWAEYFPRALSLGFWFGFYQCKLGNAPGYLHELCCPILCLAVLGWISFSICMHLVIQHHAFLKVGLPTWNSPPLDLCIKHLKKLFFFAKVWLGALLSSYLREVSTI